MGPGIGTLCMLTVVTVVMRDEVVMAVVEVVVMAN